MMIVASNSITVSNVNDGTVVHIAYANSADGKDGFYVGGANNLLTGTDNPTVTGTYTQGYLSNETTDDFLTLFKGLEGQTVTVSVDYKYSGFVAGSGQNRLGWEAAIVADTTVYDGTWYSPYNDSGSGQISRTFVVPKNITSIAYAFGFIHFSGSGTGTLSHLKLEKGSVATPWSPAPSEAHPIYMGTYTDYTQADSTDPTAYKWSQIKGADGAQGTPGTSGKVANILATAQVFKSMDGGVTFTPDSITLTPSLQSVAFSKWQYSVDGGLTWIDAVTGAHGITISDNILTLSKNSDLYTDTITSVVIKLTTDDSTVYDTETIVRLLDATSANIQIGGRNLFLNSAVNQKNITFWTLGDVTVLQDLTNTYQGLSSIQITKGTTSVGGIHNDSCVPVLQGGKTYTWSFMVKTSVSFTPSGNKLLAMQLVNGTDLHCEANMKYYPATVPANVWTKVWVTFDAPILHDTYSWDAYIWYLDNNAVYNVLNFKLEEGNSPTDWTPAPNDVQIKDLITEYYLSTSAADLVGGSWGTYFPTITSDTYLWERTTISYTDGSTIISTPVLDNAIQTNTTDIQKLDGRITSQVTATTTVTKALADIDQSLTDYKSTVTTTYYTKSEIDQQAESVKTKIQQAVKDAQKNTLTTLAETVVDARGFTVSTAGADTHTTIDGAGVMVKDAQNNDVANFKASGSEIQKLKVINDASMGAHNTQTYTDCELNENTMEDGDSIVGSADFWIGDITL